MKEMLFLFTKNHKTMSEFKVVYLSLDSVIKSTYIVASSKDEARELVFNRVLDCSQTLSAEYTS